MNLGVQPSSSPRWYVIYTHAKQEYRAISNLQAWNVETFNPRLRGRRLGSVAGHVKHANKPLFPHYVFAHFDAKSMLQKVCFTRGVYSVISFGGVLAAVDESIIELIKAQMDEDGFVRLGNDFKTGDKVMIKSGPLKNFIGVFERQMKHSERVAILLTTVNYQSRAIVTKEMIMKMAV
jgi:transcription elongation factor/antiterminator RfaH